MNLKIIFAIASKITTFVVVVVRAKKNEEKKERLISMLPKVMQ